jgi:hypothetical protein
VLAHAHLTATLTFPLGSSSMLLLSSLFSRSGRGEAGSMPTNFSMLTSMSVSSLEGQHWLDRPPSPPLTPIAGCVRQQGSLAALELRREAKPETRDSDWSLQQQRHSSRMPR